MIESLPIRLLSWAIRKIGTETLLLLGMLLVVLYSLTYGLGEAVREVEAGLLFPVSVFGLFTSWLLARSRLKVFPAALLVTAIGIVTISYKIGAMQNQLWQLLLALNGLAASALHWRYGLPLPDPGPVWQALLSFWQSIAILLGRVYTWLTQLLSGALDFDPVAAAIVWSMIVWFVAGWAGWAVRRKTHPLLAVAPAGALLATSLAYVRGNPTILLPLLAVLLLLTAFVFYHNRQRSWEASGLDFAEDIRVEQYFVVVALSGALVFMAALAPSLSIQRMIELAQHLSQPAVAHQDRIGRSLGLDPLSGSREPTGLAGWRAGGLPRSHLLGSGPELSQEVVMVISTGDLPPGPPELVYSRPVPRYYWRFLTYDQYTGAGWSTGQTETVKYRGGEATIPTREAANFQTQAPTRIVRQEVRLADYSDNSHLLYVTGELLSADQRYEAVWRTLPNQSSNGDLFGATIEAGEYQAESTLPIPTVEQLRSSGSDYPEWVRRRYLLLPDSLPSRVQALAWNLTATEPTPYDRAKAIENYLRTIPYSLEVPLPPNRRDVTDYFLFELRQGYCDYYATAMVVLARAAGLPARLVLGFAGGGYDAFNAEYIVTEADAHSWVEIYFSGIGWIEFEPTASQPEISRPDANPEPEKQITEDRPVPSIGPRLAFYRSPWVNYSIGLISSLLILTGFFILGDRWLLQRLSPAETVTNLYRRLYRRGKVLAGPVQAGNTPYEFGAICQRRLEGLARGGLFSQVLVSSVPEFHQLIDLYVHTSYSPHSPRKVDQDNAIRLWNRLRWRLWLSWLLISV